MDKSITEDARQLALKEIEKYNTPSILNLETAYNKGQELAGKLGADIDIVAIGTLMMDIKLGEMYRQGKMAEHVQKSVEFTKEFLSKHKIEAETAKKIVNCVEAHHKTVPFICKEAEICANSDCYRFILPLNVFELVSTLVKEGMPLQKSLAFARDKLEEKHNILSIDICKKELEPHYQKFRLLFTDSLK